MEAAAAASVQQTNYIYLEPREWRVNLDTENQTKFERFFMETPFCNEMQEVLLLESWTYEWCEIISKNLPLAKGVKYNFVFWLDGGENDRFNERCEFHVIFTDCLEDVSCKDWEQYSIPFKADDEFTQLCFVTQYAPMALLRADSLEVYCGLYDITDEYEDLRPQRHNIVFEDGWLTDKFYAARVLASKAQKGGEQGMQRLSV